MYPVELYLKIRQACLVDGKSQRQASKEFGINRHTISKMINHPVPPGYQRKVPAIQPVLDPHKDFITSILESDKKVHRKQKHTAKKIYERAQQECGYRGSYTIIRDYIAKWRLKGKESFDFLRGV